MFLQLVQLVFWLESSSAQFLALTFVMLAMEVMAVIFQECILKKDLAKKQEQCTCEYTSYSSAGLAKLLYYCTTPIGSISGHAKVDNDIARSICSNWQ